MKKRMLVIAAAVTATMMMTCPVMADDFKVGICNYVDDASLNQIVDNIQSRLEEIGEEKGVTFDVSYDNCNADASVMEQIISDFQADNVDLMVGVATPVAMRMQSATEGTDTPVVFSAVSDPVGSGLVDSLEAPGANITGTSDYLDTSSIMKLIEAGIPHYTGADSFALNGAFVGYGVDYANLGQKTADMIADILVDGAIPSETAVETFDNGTATVNTETCEALGLDFDTVKKAFEPLCTQVNEITTAESFDDVEAK